ncbi:MAG: hypothetical protein ACR2N7_05025 [Acidimicrobiia bacterium]
MSDPNMSEPNMPDPNPIAIRMAAHTYIEAYNEPDADRKRQMLAESFSAQGVYSSNNQELDFSGVLAMASDFHETAVMEIVGDVTVHHRYATFRWRYVQTATGEEATGVDFCVANTDGLLETVVVFFD